MRKWFERNAKDVIIISYLIPILIASILSISHVVSWYDITNPISWAVYLSIGIEIAALSALAGIITKVNKYVYIPFILVTFIQFVGNVFYGYQYIDVQSQLFQDWVELTAPLFDWMNFIEPGNMIAHKRLLAFIGGGLIPIISLSFLHLLVSSLSEYEEEEKNTIEESDETNDNAVEEGEEPDETELHWGVTRENDPIIEEPQSSPDNEAKEAINEWKEEVATDDELSGTTLNISGATSEDILTGDTNEHTTEESQENKEEKESSGQEQKQKQPQRKKEIRKENLPEWRKRRNKKEGSNIIQRVDDYAKKRTK